MGFKRINGVRPLAQRQNSLRELDLLRVAAAADDDVEILNSERHQSEVESREHARQAGQNDQHDILVRSWRRDCSLFACHAWIPLRFVKHLASCVKHLWQTLKR